MSQAFTGEIRLLPYKFVPAGWAWCDGQILNVNQFAALFSILGVTYGGNGQTNFGLPNLMARSPMGCGSGPGLTPRAWGAYGGSGTTSLSVNQMPEHSHTLYGDDVAGTQGSPSGQTYPSRDQLNKRYESNPLPANMVAMGTDSLADAGDGYAHENRQPWLVVHHCICLNGEYPVRP